jgi:tetratricopeptide (TPR) repeat protein
MKTRPAFLLFFGLLLLASCRSPRTYLDRGNNFFAAGKYEDAALNYRQAVQKDKSFGEAYYRLGVTELQRKNAREAYNALTTAAGLLPGRSDVQVALADLLLKSYLSDKRHPTRLYNDLTRLAVQFLARNPNSYDGLRIKANLAWSDQHFQESEEYFTKANAAKPLQPELVAAWTQVLFDDSQVVEAERLAQDCIQRCQDPASVFDVLYRYYRSHQRPADAANVLRAKVVKYPANIDYGLQLATHYAAAGKRDQMAAVLRALDNPQVYPDAHLKLGDFHAIHQDWPAALQQYEAGARSDPKDRITYLKRIADAWILQGKPEQASGVVGEILKEQPNDEAAQAINAAILFKSGQPAKIQAAVNQLQALVKKSPDNPVWRLSLGRALMANRDFDGARTQFQESIRLRPNFLPPRIALAEDSRLKHDYAETLRYANEVLSVSPNLATARLLRVVGLIGTARYPDARTDLVVLEHDFPDDQEVQYQLAALEVAEKKFPAAEARLQKLYTEEKPDPKILAGLVEAYRAENRVDKAVDFLTADLKKSPDSVPDRLMLAEAAVWSRKYDLAVEQYQLLLTKGPRSPQLRMRLGSVYELQGHVNEAVASFQMAVNLAPRDPAAAASLADALRLAGRDTEAIAAYRNALALDPQNAKAMNSLAFLLIEGEINIDEAQSLVQRALQKSPQEPDFQDTLGLVYLKKNSADSAIRVFQNLADHYPDNPLYRYHLGLALLKIGEKDKARAELQAALPKNPSEKVRRNIQITLATIR